MAIDIDTYKRLVDPEVERIRETLKRYKYFIQKQDEHIEILEKKIASLDVIRKIDEETIKNYKYQNRTRFFSMWISGLVLGLGLPDLIKIIERLFV